MDSTLKQFTSRKEILMENHTLVSIALCTYNGARFLREQLDTLVSQTYENIEIIAVDDCSTDGTFEILEAYAGKYPQIKVFRNQQNLGFIQNFDLSVRLCTGSLIALCDQDDLWHPRKIELQVNAIGENVFIYHDSEFIHQDGTSMNRKMSDLMNLYRGGNPEVFLFFNCISGHTILMKRELLDYALPMNNKYFHDWWLAYVATNIGEIDFIPECLVKYRQHDKSETNILQISRSKDNYKLSSYQHFDKTLNWLYYCSAFKANKNHVLIDQIYQAYKQRLSSFVSFKLSVLFFSHWEKIFYVKKKSAFSKLNYIRKQMFGFNSKNIVKSAF